MSLLNYLNSYDSLTLQLEQYLLSSLNSTSWTLDETCKFDIFKKNFSKQAINWNFVLLIEHDQTWHDRSFLDKSCRGTQFVFSYFSEMRLLWKFIALWVLHFINFLITNLVKQSYCIIITSPFEFIETKLMNLQ